MLVFVDFLVNYTVKEKVVEPLAIEPLAAESFAWIEPLTVESFAWIESELDVPMAFSLPEEPAMVSFAAPMQFAGENRIENYLADLAETMRQRQMLDLDQLRSSGQKADNVTFTDLVWSDDDLFDAEWIGVSEQPEEGDFWDEIFEDDLVLLK